MTARTARRDLRRAGCTCHPTISPLPDDVVKAAGMAAGALIQHEVGCVLGDKVKVANDRGIFPPLVSRSTSCSR